MNLKFIGQGLDPESDVTTGNFIIDSLGSNHYNSFNAFVAFVSTGGLKNIIDQLIQFKANGGEIRLYLGVNLNATSKEALEKLLEHEIESYVIYSPNNIIYHPKIYTFEGGEVTRTIIGSSNLTTSGLFQNVEASVCVDFENDDENGSNFIADIYEHFNSIINIENQSCQKLTPEILALLIENKIVLPEAVNRAKSNKINQEFGQKGFAKNKELLETFGKLKAKRPPKGFKKVVSKEELIVEPDENINVVNETTPLLAGSMWIETRQMTGASRNILDLSMTGKLDGEDKAGSLSFFEVDANDKTLIKNITIQHGGKNYIGNTILFPQGELSNQTWRLQLKGVTVDGGKLTTISRPQLGRDGGFMNKVLLFTKIDNTTYKMEILSAEDLDNLKELSSDWARGGSRRDAKAYGFI